MPPFPQTDNQLPELPGALGQIASPQALPPQAATPLPQPPQAGPQAPPTAIAPAMPEGPTDDEIVQSVAAFYAQADNSKQYRLRRNALNRDAFLGIQDFSDKISGQSTEFIPKTGSAVEQFGSWFKRSTMQIGGDWYEVKVPPYMPGFSGAATKAITDLFLDDLLTNDQKYSNFSTVLSDAGRVGALESLIIAKLSGNIVPYGNADGGPVWKLRIDLIPFEQYFADPSGANLFEIHEFEADLWAIQQRAKEGLYDQAAVDKLTDSMRLNHQQGDRRASGRAQTESTPPSIRKRVVIREFWGTMLDKNGNVVMHNAVCAVANNQHLIRPLAPNPYMHGQSPFVVCPVMRVPFSEHHKAIFDDASMLNFALNDLYNLIIDGAIGSVWGTRQLRHSYLENPEQVTDGIPQGETLVVSANLPPGQKVLENIAESDIPAEAFTTLELLNREFTAAALTSELRLGQTPQKEVKATEIVQIDQGISQVLDGIAGDIEKNFIEPVLRKAIVLIAQFADKANPIALANVLGPMQAQEYLSLPPQQRVSMTFPAGVKVRGLSAVLERVRNFQKLMALLQVVTTNPLFMQSFFMRYSPDALLRYIMKVLQLDPTDFQRAGREGQEELQRDLAGMAMFGGMGGPQQSGPPQQGGGTSPRGEGREGTPNQGGPGTGGNPNTAVVNQLINPMTGFSAAQ